MYSTSQKVQPSKVQGLHETRLQYTESEHAAIDCMSRVERVR